MKRILVGLAMLGVLAVACGTSEPPAGGSPVMRATPSPAEAALSAPELVGMTEGDAMMSLSNLGIIDVFQMSVQTTDGEPGEIVSQTPLAGTSVTTGTHFQLFVAVEPPTPKELARQVASSIELIAPGSTEFATLASSDGYMLECPTDPCMQNAHRVPFGLSIAIVSDAKFGPQYAAIKQAVELHLEDLRALRFRYVVMAGGFSGRDIAFGFRVSDWPLFHTPNQPGDVLMGLIRNQSVPYASV